MFVDVTNAERYKGNEVVPNGSGEPFGALPEGSLVAADYWDEHCVECGAPLCYKTCEMFRQTPARSCSRFNQGMRPVRMPDGTYGVAVHFRRWGKMELLYKGRMVEVSRAVKLWKRDVRVSALIRGLNKLTSLMAPFGRRTLISAYRHARDKFVMKRYGKRGSCPNTWRIKCHVSQPTSLMAAIANNDGEMFIQKLDLSLGWNKFEFAIPRLDSEVYFRVYSIEGTPCSVLFSDLDVLYVPPNAAHAKHVKCVAWDLDNTLWQGILVEDGEDGVKVREESVKTIIELDRRGIMNTICSKNDRETAWPVLEKLGLAEYFVFPSINWNPKSENLRQIAKDMNIGIDTFAFVDDSPNERGEVSANLPMVRVYRETEVRGLLDRPEFLPPVSSESSKRRFSYLAEMKRKKSEHDYSGDHEAFLRSCEIKLSFLGNLDASVSRRCWELVNRTNQLTLAAHRYTEESFDNLIRDCQARAIRCSDKYGDYGIVGFVAWKIVDNVAHVKEFVMSCRVAGKMCEFATVSWLSDLTEKAGGASVVAEAVATGRNKALIAAFDAMPGIGKSEAGGKIRYEMALPRKVKIDIPILVQ